jgi:LPS-assembly protein
MRPFYPVHRPAPLRPHAVGCAVLLLCTAPLGAWAQAVTGPARLRASPLLQESLSSDIQNQLPTFIFGDHITGRTDLDTVVDGHAEIRRSGTVLRADRIEYYPPDDLAKARGNVRMNRNGNVYQGSEAQIKVETSEGYFLQPRYQILKNGAQGEAARIDFIDDKRTVAKEATYSTCQRRPGPSWMPDWVLKAAQISLDTETEVGEAKDVQLRFKDVPLLAWPEVSFPLNDARKSGWLPPALNIDNTSGVELMVPYYWNIAPNRDATFFPSLATKRGLNVGGEFRYLEKDYSGTARLDGSPYDRLRGRSRWGLATAHSGSVYSGLPAVGSLGLNLSLNRVSDDNYWSDFPRATPALTQRLLATDGALSWAQGPVSLNARVLKWQTLQLPRAVIIPPYDRLPQLTARYTRNNWQGLDVSGELDHTQFRSQQALTLQPNAHRSYAQAQVSKPWTAPGYFVIPKVQLHATDYRFDSALTTGDTQARRIVPTLSLDSGLVYERDATFFGRNFNQTLEPRAFYSYTPFRNQSAVPNYDSGANDFNFATIFTENSFVGNDRFADNNLLTLGVTSRWLDPATGAEAVRLSYAQRLRFSEQQVVLPGGLTQKGGLSDMLFGATINWSPHWSTEAVLQYNPPTGRSQRSTLGARYSPSDYRSISANYRFAKDASEQIDIGWQWPINDLWGDKGQNLGRGAGQGEGRWYSVGRLNYSLQDRKIVDSIAGFEYDAGCWLGRVVLERLQTTSTSANKRILLQLEFVGFTRVGSNPLKLLKDNVPRYQYLREKTITGPSRFSNYD